MILFFICTSLEPGRNGVGDYTRQLARACVTRGHACTLLALNDQHTREATDQTDGGLREIRLPASLPWDERISAAAAHIKAAAPDWVSWQLVSYGFNPRGLLPSVLARRASELRGRRTHVMLHEIWIGLEAGAKPRARLIGWLQKQTILRFLRALKASVSTTSNAAYQQALAHEGYTTRLLELFSNVPIASPAAEGRGLFHRHLLTLDLKQALIGVTFGTLHAQWTPGAAIAWFHATARQLGRKPVLVAIGRGGPHAQGILNAFERAGITVANVGEQSEATVSQLLREADFGFAPHPWALIGKSGAAAAMLEHGLPVVVPRDDWTLRSGPTPSMTSHPRLARLAHLSPESTAYFLSTRQPPPPSSDPSATFLAGLL